MRATRFGDVTAVHLSTIRSRAAGYGVYVFLARGTLIDTGFHAARRDLATLLDERKPAGVLLTHQHEDHAGNAALVARRAIPIGAGAGTIAAVRDIAPIGVYRRFAWSSMPALRTSIAPYSQPDLELIHTPGHSPDHHIIWDAERSTLFSADLYLGVKVRVARPGEDPRLLIGSLRRTAALRPELMLDSHRGRVERPAEMLLAKAAWIEDTVGRIDALIAKGWSDFAIRDEVLGREGPVGYLSFGDLSKLNFVRAVRETR